MNNKYLELFDSGKWMVRTSDNGKSYEGFTWAPIGECTKAHDWVSTPECGHGLHGQNKECHGYFQISGERLELCETNKIPISIEADKVKCRRARIIAINEDIPAEFLHAVDLEFNGKTSLPLVTSVGGNKGKYIKGKFVPYT